MHWFGYLINDSLQGLITLDDDQQDFVSMFTKEAGLTIANDKEK